VNRLETGELMIDKTRTNRALTAAGIPMPKLILDKEARTRVFSNVNDASQKPVSLHEAGASLDSGRYNTEFIDTSFRFNGKDYYVVLRAMCVGRTCYMIMPWGTPIEAGNPSVHGSNASLDAGLLNALEEQVVLPRKSLILEICQRMGQVLGLGFYKHDMLPATGSDRVFVCETTFKFNSASSHQRLAHFRGQLTNEDFLTDEAPVKAAHAFAKEFLSGKR
jgi:hypothetical protein